MRFLTRSIATVILLIPVSGVAAQQQNVPQSWYVVQGYDRDLPACQKAWTPPVDTVFLGRAAEIKEETVPILLDGETAKTTKLTVRFEVEEAYLGVSEKQLTVVTGGDVHGYYFPAKGRYIVYGQRLPNGTVYVKYSFGTDWISPKVPATQGDKERFANDLNYLRRLPAVPQSGSVYGSVYRYPAPESLYVDFVLGSKSIRPAVPATGFKVKIQGKLAAYYPAVDKQGHYEARELPPGDYEVMLSGESPLSQPQMGKSTIVHVAAKGCAVVDLYVESFEPIRHTEWRDWDDTEDLREPPWYQGRAYIGSVKNFRPWTALVTDPRSKEKFKLSLIPLWGVEGGVVAAEIHIAQPGKPYLSHLGEWKNDDHQRFVITVEDLESGIEDSRFGADRYFQIGKTTLTVRIAAARLIRGRADCPNCPKIEELGVEMVMADDKPVPSKGEQ